MQRNTWAVIGPVNWYGPTSNLKLMFDRLVCMNGGNPREELIDHKDPELAMKLEKSPDWPALSLNHLEGRTAGFFCYGDGGGDELDASGRPKKLRHKEYFSPDQEPFTEMREAYGPIVWQSRYSGIEVPEHLWRYCEFGNGQKYSENQAEDLLTKEDVLREFDQWVTEFKMFVEAKGKVKPGQFRAVGFSPPSHKLADAKLLWRDYRMRFGMPRKESSPEIQQREGINRDAVLQPSKSESDQSS